MAEDLTVRVITNSHVPVIGPDMQFLNVRRVTIYVGRFGPFTHDFGNNADSPENINAWKQRMVNEVQSVL